MGQRGCFKMMALVFFGLAAALVAGWLRRRRIAILLVAVTLALAVHLFLWEVYSPEYGFRMPWIQT